MDELNNAQRNEQIQLIMRQTNYTEEESLNKLIEFNYDVLKTIKSYFNIGEKKEKVLSVNQEIYKHLRVKLNTQNTHLI
jgi:septum formation topological specificity factor MinE